MSENDVNENAPKQPAMTAQEDREVRNAIFAAREAAQGRAFGMVSREEVARQELGIEIPTAMVPLPSKGLVYPVDSPLYNKEQIEIKGMTAKEEDILMSRALIKKGTVITELIKSCLMNPTIDVNSMISGDRNALMVAIRITGYGSDYTPTVQCPGCENRVEVPINLADLEIKNLEIAPREPGVNAFDFLLPVSKKKVTFRFLTGKEEEEILAGMEAKKKRGIQNDNVITTRLQYSIIAIDDKADRGMVSKMSQYMPARDSLALRKYIDEHEPGIDMRFRFSCNSCNYEEVIAVPMGASFFWPNAGG